MATIFSPHRNFQSKFIFLLTPKTRQKYHAIKSTERALYCMNGKFLYISQFDVAYPLVHTAREADWEKEKNARIEVHFEASFDQN